jgi:hypothetical protein
LLKALNEAKKERREDNKVDDVCYFTRSENGKIVGMIRRIYVDGRS